MRRLFASLIRLYPRDFRERFGDAMQADLETGWRSLSGLRARLRFVRRTVVETAAHAVGERFSARTACDPVAPSAATGWELAWHDARLAVRLLLRNPAATATSVATLGIGLGIVTAVYSLVDGVLLKPLPFPEPERLVRIWSAEVDGERRFLEATWQEIERFGGMESFESVTALSVAPRDLVDQAGSPTGIEIARVARGFLETFGREPLFGRGFTDEESRRGDPVVLVSDEFWRDRYGAEPSVLGTTVRIQGQAHEIVGVLPREFDVPHGVAFWRPFTTAENADDDRELVAFARMRAGVGLDEANAELAATLGGGDPPSLAAWAQPFRAAIVREVRDPLWMLLAAVVALLLLVCSNVAHLQLARISSRRQELAVRSALGADAHRLLRLLLFESLALGLFSAGFGLVVGGALLGLFRRWAPADLPRLAEVAIDARIVAAWAVASVVAGLLAGWLPARHGAGAEPGRDLGSRDGLSSRGRARGILVTTEVALATLLAATAALIFTSLGEQLDVDHGVDLEGVVRLRLSPPADNDEPADRPAFYHRMVEAVATIPGIEAGAVGLGNHDVLSPDGFLMPFELPEDPRGASALEPGRKAITRIVDGGWMRAAGLRLLAGRLIDPTLDGAATGAEPRGAAVVDQIFVRQELGLEEPGKAIGRLLRHPAFYGDYPAEHRIVGVVAAVRPHAAVQPAPKIYLPYSQFPWPRMHLLARSAPPSAERFGGDLERAVEALVPLIRARIWALEPTAPIGPPETLATAVARGLEHRRFELRLTSGFAYLALLLAATGIYALLSNEIVHRLREIGLRQALGADRLDVARWVFGRALALVLPGLGAGLLGAYFAGRMLAHRLYGVSAAEPLLWAFVSACLLLVTIASALPPLRRALAAQPTKLLSQS